VFYVYDTSSASTILLNYIILGTILLAVAVLAYFVLRKLRYFDRVGISKKGITWHVSGKEIEFYSWGEVACVEKCSKSHSKSTLYIKITVKENKELFIEYRQEVYDEINGYMYG
jgi:hypothetical protein